MSGPYTEGSIPALDSEVLRSLEQSWYFATVCTYPVRHTHQTLPDQRGL